MGYGHIFWVSLRGDRDPPGAINGFPKPRVGGERSNTGPQFGKRDAAKKVSPLLARPLRTMYKWRKGRVIKEKVHFLTYFIFIYIYIRWPLSSRGVGTVSGVLFCGFPKVLVQVPMVSGSICFINRINPPKVLKIFYFCWIKKMELWNAWVNPELYPESRNHNRIIWIERWREW